MKAEILNLTPDEVRWRAEGDNIPTSWPRWAPPGMSAEDFAVGEILCVEADGEWDGLAEKAADIEKGLTFVVVVGSNDFGECEIAKIPVPEEDMAAYIAYCDG